MPEWIRFSERMPDPGDRVIVWNGRYSEAEMAYFDADWGDGQWCDPRESCPIAELEDITHWMPLPGEPKD